MSQNTPQLLWLEPWHSFPDHINAWDEKTDAPGLLAAGGELSTQWLLQAYRRGIFPWFSAGQPILWWSPDPRMVLKVSDFKLHRSLRKAIARFQSSIGCDIRFNTAFEQVMQACAHIDRNGHSSTWILPEMMEAYADMHRQGYAHSVETWIDGKLAGGLYLVAIGQAVFGESMFSLKTDASKIALAALVAFCRSKGIHTIDCQQNTRHLASLGAREIARAAFIRQVEHACGLNAPDWSFDPRAWRYLSPTSAQ